MFTKIVKAFIRNAEAIRFPGYLNRTCKCHIFTSIFANFMHLRMKNDLVSMFHKISNFKLWT